MRIFDLVVFVFHENIYARRIKLLLNVDGPTTPVLFMRLGGESIVTRKTIPLSVTKKERFFIIGLLSVVYIYFN